MLYDSVLGTSKSDTIYICISIDQMFKTIVQIIDHLEIQEKSSLEMPQYKRSCIG